MDVAAAPLTSLTPRPMQVTERVEEMAATVTLTLDGGLPFRPGQFVMVSCPGVGDVPISISGDAADERRLVLTVRAVGAVSRAIVAAEPGRFLGIRGPYGTAWPEPAGGDLLVMAGGLGLAPLRGAILRAIRDARLRRVVLLYGAREPDAVLFAAELDRWRQARAEVRVTVDAAEPGWTGNVGLITALLERERLDAAATTALLCGPEVMMRHSARALVGRGVAPERIHLSLERHMACGAAVCGRCQLGPLLLCRDGPVVRWVDVARALAIAEL